MTFVYRDPAARAAAQQPNVYAMVARDGRLYVRDDAGMLVESQDWALFLGLLAGVRGGADGSPQ